MADLNPSHQHADGRALTDEEQRNAAAHGPFRELYNGEDMERFVREAYAPTFHVLNLDCSSWTAGAPNRQNLLDDADAFIRAEVFIKAAAPGRRMEFRRVIPAGNVVTLEATGVVAGPSCTRVLADLGAEVIKVEPPQGDLLRTGWPRRRGARPVRLELAELEAAGVLVARDDRRRGGVAPGPLSLGRSGVVAAAPTGAHPSPAE